MNKLLLYCTKAKPYLEFKQIPRTLMDIDNSFEGYRCSWKRTEDDNNFQLNGTIVAECDFEVEEICSEKLDVGVGYEPLFYTETIDDITKGSYLTQFEIENYLGCKEGGEVVGYAIHIKNLHIFGKPIDIRNYYNIAPRTMADCMNQKTLLKAPQNMCNAYDMYKNHYVLISIQAEWLCKILNGEKTIEVRKKVLKEVLENE